MSQSSKAPFFHLRRFLSRFRGDFFLPKIDPKKIPQHVAVIMDGNGRWAVKRGLPKIEGHRVGAKVAREIVKASVELGIKYLTLYTFSAENWERPQAEVEELINLLEERLEKEREELNRRGVKLRVIGDLEKFPKTTKKVFEEVVKLTKKNNRLVLNIALNYSGRAEIAAALKRIIKKTKNNEISIDDIDEQMIANHLYTAGIPDPELLIRTSGELRVSNYLLWQIAYTELWVTNTFWPDFGRRKFFQAIHNFQKRERRFGR